MTKHFNLIDCCANNVIVLYVLPYQNTRTCSSTSPLWSPPLLMCFLALSWCYPDLRPTRAQTYFALIDCCINNVFIAFCFFKLTHTFLYISSMIPINIVVFPWPSMILSRSKANSGSHGFCIIWLLCSRSFFSVFPYSEHSHMFLNTSSVMPTIVVVFPCPTICYPHLRPTWTQKDLD